MQYLKAGIREKILKAAIKEFLEQGYADASIRNIADSADISLGNIYRYFTNKEALYLAIVNPVLDAAIKKINSLFGLDIENFMKLPEVLIEFINNYKLQLQIVSKGTKEQYEYFINAIVQTFENNIKRSVAQRYPQLAQNIQDESFYLAIASSFIHGVLVIIKSHESDEKRVQCIRELFLFFFNRIDVRFGNF